MFAAATEATEEVATWSENTAQRSTRPSYS